MATATLDIDYRELASGSIRRVPLFSEQRTLDPAVRPPADPVDPCGKAARGETAEARRARLRDRARTDPAGADAEAIAGMNRNELLATAINSAGYLCARVTDMYPRRGAIVVHCVEYRSGKGRVSYLVDAGAGTVEPLR